MIPASLLNLSHLLAYTSSIMSNQQLVESKGIFHGLPVYPSSLKGLTAIITGANGISGNYMLRVLAQDPERWSKIYCLSRRPPTIADGLPKNAEHIPLDFLQEPEEIAKVLKDKGVKADYVFFYSYVQVKPKEGGGLWSDAEEMCKVNSKCQSIKRHKDTGITYCSCSTQELLRSSSDCQYQAEAHHAPDRREELWCTSWPRSDPSRRNGTACHFRTQFLLPTGRLSLGFLQESGH